MTDLTMSKNELYDYIITLLAKKDYSSGGMTGLLRKLTEKRNTLIGLLNV